MAEKTPEKRNIQAPDNPHAVMAPKQKNTKPTFLGIAPELRSRIYYAALTQPELIDISTSAARRQPALLSVCRQIRNEAIGIYYTDNSFSFECCKVDWRKAFPFCDLQREYHVEHKLKLQVNMCGHRSHMESLHTWLKRYHQFPEKTPRPTEGGKQELGNNSVLEAFDVVDKMRNKMWSAVEKELECTLHTIAYVQRGRAWDVRN